MSHTTAQQNTTKAISPAPVSGVLQRACACGSHASGGECESCQRKRQESTDLLQRSPGQPFEPASRAYTGPRFGHDFSRISTHAPAVGATQMKLAINKLGDHYEQEADRVAEQAMSAPVHTAVSDTIPRIQRFAGQPTGRVDMAPASVDQALGTPGRPLEPALRQDMEQRFGHDFTHVRVHTSVAAERSAQEVNALAYTVGQHIVFGSGQFTPQTPVGQRLIAHELTHTIQQGDRQGNLQRFVSCSAPTMMLGEDCPKREPNEVRSSREGPTVVLEYSGLTDTGNPDRGQLVANFGVGRSATKADLASDLTWKAFVSDMITNPSVRWEILGFTDCEGDAAKNKRLRKERADALYNSLPKAAQNQIVQHEAASIDDCIAGNNDRGGRALNRSALVRRVDTVYQFEEDEGEEIKGEKAKFVCGPDVTEELARTVNRLRSTFAGFNADQQEKVCGALTSYKYGEIAWDVIDLCDKCSNGNIWISRDYRPPCATVGATPPCGPTVQVGDQCYFSGSANYVIYGVMFKLCNAVDSSEFNSSEMKGWIYFYKSSSSNVDTSAAWAQEGYSGWSGGSVSVPGDRPNCKPMCPSPYTGPAFRVRWCTELDTDGLCASGSR